MGLFDKFFGRAPKSDVVTLAPSPRPPSVPDVDNDDSGLPHDVRARLEALTREAHLDVDDLSPEEFDAALTSRLVDADRLTTSGLDFSYSSAFAPHLREVLTLDLPSAIVTLPDDRVAERGVRLPRLLDQARRNLQQHMRTADVQVTRVGGPNRSVQVISGDSPYTASYARFLTEALELWHPHADTHGGIVFALPHRHAIVYQLCSNARQAQDAIELVPAQAEAMQTDGLSPVSPHVYLWLDRQVTCLTEWAPGGGLTLRLTPHLEGVLAGGRHRAAG